MTKKSVLQVVPKQDRPGEGQKAMPARVLSPFDEFDRMMENFFPSGWLRSSLFDRPHWGPATSRFEMKMPAVDVVDRDDEVLVRAEVPGIDKKDIDISVNDNSVTIKGETSHEVKEEKGEYHRCEISRGSFARTVVLPAYVDGSKAKASFKDGVLELTLPKLEKSKRHSIKVE